MYQTDEKALNRAWELIEKLHTVYGNKDHRISYAGTSINGDFMEVLVANETMPVKKGQAYESAREEWKRKFQRICEDEWLWPSVHDGLEIRYRTPETAELWTCWEEIYSDVLSEASLAVTLIRKYRNRDFKRSVRHADRDLRVQDEIMSLMVLGCFNSVTDGSGNEVDRWKLEKAIEEARVKLKSRVAGDWADSAEVMELVAWLELKEPDQLDEDTRAVIDGLVRDFPLPELVAEADKYIEWIRGTTCLVEPSATEPMITIMDKIDEAAAAWAEKNREAIEERIVNAFATPEIINNY